MNTPNNKRRRDSQMKIEKAFVRLLQDVDMEKISVAALCKEAGVNRSTFYANYEDVFALAEAVRRGLAEEVLDLYQPEREGKYHSYDFLRLFRHIYDNQIFYKTYFKLGSSSDIQHFGLDVAMAEKLYGSKNIEYHVAFFYSGLNAVIRRWLENGCRETPEEIDEVIRREYGVKQWFAEENRQKET